ncbi:MAG: multinuclear nonheme iron-dependent oxidase [Bdellovibrionota bacterium]
MTRFPEIKDRLGLGLGMDMPWGKVIGFQNEGDSGRPSPRVEKFLQSHSQDFSYFFFSFQPRNRNQLDLAEYQPAYESLLSHIPKSWNVALHQTTCNLGSAEPYGREQVIDFTNQLINTFQLRWVNEDLGIWSLRGKSLPYPLPPFLNAAGLAACIDNVAFYQERLHAPLLVEFPGFTDGSNFYIGKAHAYDYFRAVVEETNSPCTLDTGHLLSYQWLLGKRGEEIYSELERLPLSSCFEIHLSGCQVVNDRFIDFHHGIIMDEQITMLEKLLARCPNVKAVTFEDPKFDEHGVLIEKSLKNFLRLKEIVARWKA